MEHQTVAPLVEVLVEYKVSVLTFITYWGLYFASDFIFARLFAFYRKLNNADRAEWASRVVSTINALAVTYGCVAVLISEKELHNDPVYGYSLRAEFYHKLIMGYFVYDFLLVLGHKQLRGVGTVVHHVLGFLGPAAATYYREGQLFTVLWIFTEVTTPLVNNRWFLAMAKKSHTQFYILNGLAMTLGFIVFRVLLVPGYSIYALYTFWQRFRTANLVIQYLTFTCIIGVSSLNTYWTGLMVRGLLRHLGGGKKVKKAN